jgi:N,N'-diacetyllegionaminate synthase
MYSKSRRSSRGFLKKIRIGTKEVGDGCPVFVTAEIGCNFRDVQEAKREIDLAVSCGVDSVKIQTFCAETITSRDNRFTNIAGGVSQYDLFKQFEVSEEDHHAIFEHARAKGLIAFSTPSHTDDVDLLVRLGVPAIKLGSDDLTNLPFVHYSASRGLPLILSTGMATLTEVREALDIARGTGNKQVMVLHCVSSYPVKSAEYLNLRAIQTLQTLGCPVGFSDHSRGIVASIVATTLGACFIEKHFTLDKTLDTPDSFFSADPDEMKSLVDGVRTAERSLGSGKKQPTEEERQNMREMRKSLVARRPIGCGEVVQETAIIIKRPGYGIAPKELSAVIGKTANRDIAEDEVLLWEKLI